MARNGTRSRTRIAGAAGLAAWLVTSIPGAEAGTAREADPPIGHTDYRTAHWTIAEGLPQNTVNDIRLPPSGELWLATFGGLAIFDGHQFKVVDMASDEQLAGNRIVSLAPAGDSFLFLTQQGHLGRFGPGRTDLLVPPPIGAAEALEMVVDRTGLILCRSSDGRGWETDGIQAWRPVVGPGRDALHDLVLDANGDAWALWGDQLLNVTAESGSPLVVPSREAVVFPGTSRGLWVGWENGLGWSADGRFEPVRVRPALQGQVSAIEADGDAAIWVATPGEVSRLERQPDGWWRRTPLPLGLAPSLTVRVLRRDHQGSLWLGTVGAGLYRINRLPTRRIGPEQGLGAVSALIADGQGGAFIADGCRQLHHVDLAGVVQAVRFDEPTDTETTGGCGISLAAGPAARVWARVGSRLFQVRREDLSARLAVRGLPADEGPVIVNADESVWVVSRSGNVRLLSPGGRTLRALPLPAPLISASLGPDGTLWIGGDGEVFHVGANAVEQYGRGEQVPRGLVRDVLAESDGTVWIGTYGGGMGRMRAGQVARLTSREGLPDNAVSRLLDDGRGRLWVSTNRGVAVVEKRDLHQVADGQARALEPVVFGTERGVPEANFGTPAGFADRAGGLWLGTIDGAVFIDAAAFPFNTAPPVPRIEDILADDARLAVGPRVAIPPRTGRLRVSFTAVELLYPERIRFRFRVDAVDAAWVDAGPGRTVDWSPPGPGRHRFLVMARNEDGIWSPAPAEVVLEVLPAWWETATFWGLGLISLVLAGAAGVRLRTRKIERRHAERLRVLEEQRTAEARLAAVRAQLDHVSRAALAGELAASLAHEVGQPIGAIVNNAEAGKRHLAQYLRHPENLEQIFGDIVADGMRAAEVVKGLRGFLQLRGPEAGPIDLSALVREMLPLVRRELQDNRVEIELALQEELPQVEGFRVQLGQIVVNLVINACEALGQVTGDRRITISTRARDGHVTLVVCDNGPGLAPDVAARVFEPFVTTKPEGLGVGLAICRSIAERHGGHLRADAVSGGGLRMTLTLPAAPDRGPES